MKSSFENVEDRVEKINAHKSAPIDISLKQQKILDEISSHTYLCSQSLTEMERYIKGVQSILDELDVNFRRVGFVAGFIIFFWYLALPLLLSIVSIFLIVT